MTPERTTRENGKPASLGKYCVVRRFHKEAGVGRTVGSAIRSDRVRAMERGAILYENAELKNFQSILLKKK